MGLPTTTPGLAPARGPPELELGATIDALPRITDRVGGEIAVATIAEIDRSLLWE